MEFLRQKNITAGSNSDAQVDLGIDFTLERICLENKKVHIALALLWLKDEKYISKEDSE